MKLYLDEKDRYSTFLFLIGERGREILNTWIWLKKVDADGNPTDEDDIKLHELFKRFKDYCLAKRNQWQKGDNSSNAMNTKMNHMMPV